METTFTLTTTQPTENILAFAQAKGWSEEVTKYNEDGTSTKVPNPVSAAEFCGTYFTNLIVNDMSSLRINAVIQATQAAQQEQIKAIKDTLAATIEVTVE